MFFFTYPVTLLARIKARKQRLHRRQRCLGCGLWVLRELIAWPQSSVVTCKADKLYSNEYTHHRVLGRTSGGWWYSFKFYFNGQVLLNIINWHYRKSPISEFRERPYTPLVARMLDLPRTDIQSNENGDRIRRRFTHCQSSA